MWIFGYGSILWKTDFPAEDTMFGYIEGYHRRWWQGSPHHRGSAKRPGRVVTLVSSEQITRFSDEHAHLKDDRVWGRIHKVAGEHVEATLVQLDIREAGYERHTVLVHCQDGETRKAVMYISAPGSADFIGPAPMADMVRQIATCVGHSGRNDEYLFKLCACVRALEAHDPHLFALEAAFLEHVEQTSASRAS